MILCVVQEENLEATTPSRPLFRLWKGGSQSSIEQSLHNSICQSIYLLLQPTYYPRFCQLMIQSSFVWCDSQLDALFLCSLSLFLSLSSPNYPNSLGASSFSLPRHWSGFALLRNWSALSSKLVPASTCETKPKPVTGGDSTQRWRWNLDKTRNLGTRFKKNHLKSLKT